MRFLFSFLGRRKKVREFVQRGRRGFATSDTWSFDNYLSNVIAGGVGALRERAFGHPGDLTPEEWDDILRRIEQGFRDYDSWPSHGPEASGDAEFQEAAQLLIKWWGHLWD